MILLRERSGDRVLPVWGGRSEATALALNLETVDMPRPMTYPFISSLLTATATQVREVRITRLVEGTFYAVLLLEGPGRSSQVDARPSGAVNVAVVREAPIMVSADVLDVTAARGRTEWQSYATAGQQMVREAQGQHAPAAADRPAEP